MVKSIKRLITKNKKTKRRRRHSKNKRGGDLENEKKILELNLQSKDNNLSRMLRVACRNPDNCLELGYYADIIKQYFDNFKNFSYIKKNEIKIIGKPSTNGFILEFPFEKQGYKAYTVLKCSAKSDSDNLFYEYYVGKFFINKYIKKFPTFVETYDLYEIKDETSWQTMKNNKLATSTNDLTNLLTLQNVKESDYHLFAESCTKSKMLCVLIQHFDKFTSFSDEYKNNMDNIKYEILNILYQVYFTLVQLGDKYTHYDLHANNVFLYKPYDGKQYIKMRYHSGGNIYEFPSEYIVKIIDYGRNYFNNGTITTSEILQQYVCPASQCAPNCGTDQGYNVIQGNILDPTTHWHWITPNKPNASHDLRFAAYVTSYLNQLKLYNQFIYSSNYGTPSIANDEYNKSNQNIYSIYNMVTFLEKNLDTWNSLKINKKYDSTWTCVAEMDIYDDGRDYTFNVVSAPSYITQPAFTSPSSTSLTSVSLSSSPLSLSSTKTVGLFNMSP
jgi:hypothetical protein